jgi:DNA polymerase-4
MVGRATKEKLSKVNIRTVGDLANESPMYLKALLKSHGLLVWNYANGIDDSLVTLNSDIIQKGLGNSTTIAYDIITAREAYKVILALTERVGMRLRRMKRYAKVVSLGIKTDGFIRYSHQVKLPIAINCTEEIYECACRLLDECWKGEPIRHIGVSLSELNDFENPQISIFENVGSERLKILEKTLDNIRYKYGERSIIMGTFANGDVDPIQGGTNDGDFIMMGGYQQ